MPSYKTHSIHGETILPNIDTKIYINPEDMKAFCIGPDLLIATDYSMFNYQHRNKVKEYFETLLKIIKDDKLQSNSEVMAFVYGQLDHYILDVIIHPLIFYMTESIPKQHKIDPHGIVEMWIDDYVIQKYKITNEKYYTKNKIKNIELENVIDKTYEFVFDKNEMSKKYSKGINYINLFDRLVRDNSIKIIPFITKIFNVGDIEYSDDLKRVFPFLNLENEEWYNPETGKPSSESFEDLWIKSIEIALETISDINNYLYQDKTITNPLIINDCAYDTGLPCNQGQKLKYLKKYK